LGRARARGRKPGRETVTADTPAGQDPGDVLAYRSLSAVVIFLVTAAAGALGDLASKSKVFSQLLDSPAHSTMVIPGLLRFTLSTNPGIVFGLRLAPWAILLATMAAVVAVAVLFATSARRFRWLHVALGMVLGGALGNAYDRLFSYVHLPGESRAHVGEVRDFIDFYPISYPLFNVADILLVVGVCIILLHVFRHRKDPRPGGR